MKFCILASGSEGNCTFVEDSEGHAVLVDAGLSMRRTADHLAQVNKDLSKINAMLISHEHSDHLRGAAVLSRRLDLPIYASEGTLSLIKRYLPGTPQLHALNSCCHEFGSLEVEAFLVSHDAPETMGFLIREGERRLAIATDLGVVDLAILGWFQDCDAIILEANHDMDMLIEGSYPWDLKQRIKSTLGHLSNDQAAEALIKIATPRLKRVVLAHLSQENNSPEIALERVRGHLHGNGHTHIDVVVAEQYRPTEVFEV